MIKNVTYWGNKAEVMLAIKGIPHYFAYGQTKPLDLPDGLKLSPHYVIEDYVTPPKKSVEAKIVTENRKRKVKI